MNQVSLIGRLTKDPAISNGGQTTVARFSIAIDRGKGPNGEDKGADYPNIVCFGKTAELVGKYMTKGRLVGIIGRIQTGSYEKDGAKVYTTDVVADRVEFLSSSNSPSGNSAKDTSEEPFPNFTDDDIPF